MTRDDGCRLDAAGVLIPEGVVNSALEILANRTEYKEQYEGYMITSNKALPPTQSQASAAAAAAQKTADEKEPLV